MLGGIALAGTAYAVQDTKPLADTSWWAIGFAIFGLLYALVLPAALNAQEGPQDIGPYLRSVLLWHLVPAAVVTWYAASCFRPTSYAFLVPWCWGTFVLAVVVTVGGAGYRLFNRR